MEVVPLAEDALQVTAGSALKQRLRERLAELEQQEQRLQEEARREQERSNCLEDKHRAQATREQALYVAFTRSLIYCVDLCSPVEIVWCCIFLDTSCTSICLQLCWVYSCTPLLLHISTCIVVSINVFF